MEKALRAHHSDRNLDTTSPHKPSCVSAAADMDVETRRWGSDGRTCAHFQPCNVDNMEIVFLPIFVQMYYSSRVWQAGRDDKTLVGFDELTGLSCFSPCRIYIHLKVRHICDSCTDGWHQLSSVQITIKNEDVMHHYLFQWFMSLQKKADNLDSHHQDAFRKVKARRPVSRLRVTELGGLRGLGWGKK